MQDVSALREQKNRVLVVEDDEDVSETLAMCLADGGYAVTCVRDSASALDALRTATFAIALIDYALAGRDTGIDTAKRATAGGSRVILMSGRLDIEEDVKSFGWPFMPKPLRLEGLLRTVAAVMAGALGYNGALGPTVG